MRGRVTRRVHRGFIILLEADGRYAVYESEADARDGFLINDKLPEISTAMNWIDETQFEEERHA